MELVALHTFQTVVEEGGVLAASRKLHTVQSNVTGRIRRLEVELGVELFHRKGRGLELSPPGRVLLDYARRMLQLERQTVTALRQVGSGSGELRLGSMETFAALHLPDALQVVRRRHPGLELRIQTDTSARLIEQVMQHRLDGAFVAGPINHDDLVFLPLVDEELVQVQARDTEAAHLPLILFREGCAYRARALAWQRTLGHASAEAMEFGTLEGILGCVSVGLGWTLMPRRVVTQSRHAGLLQTTDLPARAAHVPTGLVTRRDVAPLTALSTLCEALQDAHDT